MTSLRAAYKNELFKLFCRKKYTVFCIIGVLFMILALLLGRALSALSRINLLGIFLASADFSSASLPFFTGFMLPLLSFMAVTDLFTAEAADGTLRASLSRPVVRWKLYSAKLMAVVTYLAVYLAVIFLTGQAASAVAGAFRPGDALTALLAYALSVIPLAVLACMAALLAVNLKSGSFCMFLLLIIYALLCVLPLVLPITNELLFTSYLGWRRFWIGALPPAGKLLNVLSIVFGYGAVFFISGTILFDRKDY